LGEFIFEGFGGPAGRGFLTTEDTKVFHKGHKGLFFVFAFKGHKGSPSTSSGQALRRGHGLPISTHTNSAKASGSQSLRSKPFVYPKRKAYQKKICASKVFVSFVKNLCVLCGKKISAEGALQFIFGFVAPVAFFCYF